MVIKKTLSITVFCLIFILPIYVYSSNILPFDFFSSSNDENCESQEICASKNRCKKLAKELYKKFFNSKILPVYQSYYNEELNKCFVIISSQNNTKKYLLEVNANEMIIHGIFIQANNDIDFCLVSNKGYKTKTNEDMPVKSNVKCKSRAEWDNLIKPYIEE